MSEVQQEQGEKPSSALPKRTSVDSWQLPQATHLICGVWGAAIMHPWPKPTAEVPGVPLPLEGAPAPRGSRGLGEEPNPTPWCSPGARPTCRAAAPVGKVRAVTFSLHLLPFPVFLGALHPAPAPAAAGLPIPKAPNTIPAPASPHHSSHSCFSPLQIFLHTPAWGQREFGAGIWGTGWSRGAHCGLSQGSASPALHINYNSCLWLRFFCSFNNVC